VGRWAEAAARPVGAIVPLHTLWDLAHAWYRDRLSRDWQRQPIAAAQKIFDQVGLVGLFWSLTG